MSTPDTRAPQERVLEQIKDGSVRMHSRSFFVLRTIAVLVAAVGVFILSAFLASFIFFSLEEGGEQFLLGFGFKGVMAYLILFPWPLLVLDILGIFILRFVLRGFRPVYGVSFATVLGILVALSVAFALGINSTPLHDILEEHAGNDDLPLIGQLYSDVRIPDEDKGEYRGKILSIDERVIVIFSDDHDHDEDDGTHTVYVPESFDTSDLEVGDEIYVAGEREGDHIQAYGIHTFEEEDED